MKFSPDGEFFATAGQVSVSHLETHSICSAYVYIDPIDIYKIYIGRSNGYIPQIFTIDAWMDTVDPLNAFVD